MITPLVLTLIVLICLGLVLTYAMPPLPAPLAQWAFRAVIVLISVAVILRLWGISL